MLKQQEAVMARRHLARGKELNKHTKELNPMKIGDRVSVQNQHNNTPLKWDNAGVIVELGAYDKYTVKIDGSGCLTDRSRRFLRPIRTYKEVISKLTPTAGAPPEDKAAPPQTQAEPRRSARVAKRNQAGTTGRRPFSK